MFVVNDDFARRFSSTTLGKGMCRRAFDDPRDAPAMTEHRPRHRLRHSLAGIDARSLCRVGDRTSGSDHGYQLRRSRLVAEFDFLLKPLNRPAFWTASRQDSVLQGSLYPVGCQNESTGPTDTNAGANKGNLRAQEQPGGHRRQERIYNSETSRPCDCGNWRKV
jgi:hypothetical protein